MSPFLSINFCVIPNVTFLCNCMCLCFVSVISMCYPHLIIAEYSSQSSHTSTHIFIISINVLVLVACVYAFVLSGVIPNVTSQYHLLCYPKCHLSSVIARVYVLSLSYLSPLHPCLLKFPNVTSAYHV